MTKQGTSTVLTQTLGYRNPTTTTTTAQVATLTNTASSYGKTYTYTYDDNGNILSVSDGTYTTSYVYDTANQLVRENNQQLNKTWTWTYDAAGNILSRKEYAYTTGTLGTPTDTVSYGYATSGWKDLLTSYDGGGLAKQKKQTKKDTSFLRCLFCIKGGKMQEEEPGRGVKLHGPQLSRYCGYRDRCCWMR